MSQFVFLTGATGFVGGATLTRLVAEDYTVIAALRNGSKISESKATTVYVEGFDGATPGRKVLIT